jgi:hypothetical protein
MVMSSDTLCTILIRFYDCIHCHVTFEWVVVVEILFSAWLVLAFLNCENRYFFDQFLWVKFFWLWRFLSLGFYWYLSAEESSEAHHLRNFWVFFVWNVCFCEGRRNQLNVMGTSHHWLCYEPTVSLVLPLSLWMLHVCTLFSAFYNQKPNLIFLRLSLMFYNHLLVLLCYHVTWENTYFSNIKREK